MAMYEKILVALENSKADDTLLEHIQRLAPVVGARLLLVHVADGWAARYHNDLNLVESEEMRADREYLTRIAERLTAMGIKATPMLEMGDPATEILNVADRETVDLIAMTSHGHRFLGDLIYGSTIHEVRHRSRIPVLLVRAPSK